MSDWPGDNPQPSGRPDEFHQSAEEHRPDSAAAPESTPAPSARLPAQPGDVSSGPPPARSSTWERIGCRDQIILVAASVLLAFFLMTIAAFMLGLRPNTVTTLHDNMNTLRSENELMQTAVAEIAAGQELLATIEVAVGDNEDAIAAVATVQSERNSQIDQLQERSNQVTSFLEMLSEIADRAVSGEEVRSSTPFTEATSEPIFTATSRSTDLIGPPEATETVTPTATPTVVDDAEAVEDEPTVQPARTRSPTVMPTRKATPEDAE